MNKYIYAFLFSLTIICTASTCDTYYVETVNISVENKSDETIWLNGFSFRDTTALLEPDRVFQIQDPIRELKIRDIYVFEYAMNAILLEQGRKFQIIIFKQSTLDKYTQEELIENNIYDKLYVLSYDDLEAINYKVIYTGDE